MPETQVEGPTILLDIDGVLHAYGGLEHFAPSCMRALRAIVEATGALVVLSSSWQSSKAAVEVVDEELARWGIRPVAAFTVPGPVRLTGAGVEARGHEISRWLKTQGSIGPWIALDDLPLNVAASFSEHASRHVQTDASRGLTSDQVERCIELLGGRVDGIPSLPPPPSEAELAALMSPKSQRYEQNHSPVSQEAAASPLTPWEVREQKLFAASIDHTVLGGSAFTYFSSPRRS